MLSGDPNVKDKSVVPVLKRTLDRFSVLDEMTRNIPAPNKGSSESLRGIITVDSVQQIIYLKKLPTSDPGKKDALWNSSGSVMISDGT